MKWIMNKYLNLFDPFLLKWVMKPIWFILLTYLALKIVFEIPFFKEGTLFWYNQIFNYTTDNHYWYSYIDKHDIAILASFIAAILGIAIPISLTVISSLDRKYQQGGMIKEFLKEPLNIAQYFALLTNIFIIVCTLFFNSLNPLFSLLYLTYFLLTVMSFIAYIYLIISYLINAKSHVYNKCEKALNRYFDE